MTSLMEWGKSFRDCRGESEQQAFIKLLASPNKYLANAAARVLLSRPSAMDTTALISSYATQSSHGRRLICVVLSRVPQADDSTRKLFVQACAIRMMACAGRRRGDL